MSQRYTITASDLLILQSRSNATEAWLRMIGTFAVNIMRHLVVGQNGCLEVVWHDGSLSHNNLNMDASRGI